MEITNCATNGRKHPHRRYGPVKLTPAVVGQYDAIHPDVFRHARILWMQDSLQDELAFP
jgi:hypothetical protein